MQLYFPLNSNNKNNIYGFDDSYSKDLRKFIRHHIEDNIERHPYGITDEESRALYNETMKAYIKIKSDMRFSPKKIGTSSYRGYALLGEPQKLNRLKEMGVKRVIDLTRKNEHDKPSKYQEEVENSGLEYSHFDLTEEDLISPKRPPFINLKDYLEKEVENYYDISYIERQEKEEKYNKEARKYIKDEIIPFIKNMQEGNLYIGCTFGDFRTGNALMLNSWFNINAREKFIKPENNFLFNPIKNLYNNLKDEEKAELGFTKEYDELVKNKIEKYELKQFQGFYY